MFKNLLEAILALMTSEVLQQQLVTHEQPPLANNRCKVSSYHTQWSCLKERLAVPEQSLWTWLAGKPPPCWTCTIYWIHWDHWVYPPSIPKREAFNFSLAQTALRPLWWKRLHTSFLQVIFVMLLWSQCWPRASISWAKATYEDRTELGTNFYPES